MRLRSYEVHYMIAVIHVLILAFLPSLVSSLLLHSCSPSPIIIFNGIAWQDGGSQYHDDLNGTVLVNLLLDRALFDYCDLTKYNPEGIQPLLRAHNVLLEERREHNVLLEERREDRFVIIYNTYNQNCGDDATVSRKDVKYMSNIIDRPH